jgi:hypothetical protein
MKELLMDIIRGYMVRDQLSDIDVVEGKDSWLADVSGPLLADEVDEQLWTVNRLMTTPQGDVNSSYDVTCFRSNGRLASSWGDADYEEMIANRKNFKIKEGTMVLDPDHPVFYVKLPIGSDASPKLFRSDPWNLHGDRVVVPSIMPPINVVNAILDAMMLDALEEEYDAIPDSIKTEELHLERLSARVDDMFLATLRNTTTHRKPAVIDTGEDDYDVEEEKPKPLVRKPAEPAYRPKCDDWGFPISYPTADSEPSPNSANEEPVPEEHDESPPSDQLGTDGSAVMTAKGTGSTHYESIEPALRADMIEEKGMKTRIQLTGYLAGKYIKGQADNFIIPDIMAEVVRGVLEPIAETARRRNDAEIGAGTAPAKGGPRVRIQLTEYTSNGGEYLRQNDSKVGYNLSILGMSVNQVATLVDHQIAVNFGVRRGDAEVLVVAWNAFMGTQEIAMEGSAGPNSKDVRKDERETLDFTNGNSSNAVREAVMPLRPDLLGKTYSKNLHFGFCAVVVGTNLRVMSLWAKERDAMAAARRVNARVVDAKGYLIPQAEVESAPAVAPDEVRA